MNQELKTVKVDLSYQYDRHRDYLETNTSAIIGIWEKGYS